MFHETYYSEYTTAAYRPRYHRPLRPKHNDIIKILLPVYIYRFSEMHSQIPIAINYATIHSCLECINVNNMDFTHEFFCVMIHNVKSRCKTPKELLSFVASCLYIVIHCGFKQRNLTITLFIRRYNHDNNSFYCNHYFDTGSV
jgi:hypothetical protein